MGRKLAFDGAKGRLWAVCAKCGRWNLTPIEERWEAIEECERQYRGTITRSSTDHIGLGRVKEGTDLIRVGEPLRPEFAAWRYGRYFRRRRRVQQAAVVTGIAATVALSGGLALVLNTGILATSLPYCGALLARFYSRRNELGRARRFIVQRAEAEFGKRIWKEDSVGVRIFPTDDEQGWGVRFAFDGRFLDFRGAEALHTAQIVAPAMNAEGAKPAAIDDAVSEIERAAIEGELAQLEADWREAEEIAAIADNLFLPAAVTEFIEKHRSRS